ncbi:MAG: hypothetical protein ACM3NQ_22835 [Bacteroidales bacterium]
MRPTTRRLSLLALLLLTAAMHGACIESETHATLVIEADGSGRWVVLNRDIHAVADTPEDRLREEQEFMAKVTAGRHSEAVAFRALGATDLRTQVLSHQWPFAVQTEARFANLADVFSRFFERLGVDGRATLVRDAERFTFTAVITTDAGQVDNQPTSEGEEARAMPSLLGDSLPVVFIRHGQFLAATGFTVSNDGRRAKADEVDGEQPTLTLSLTWTAKEAAAQK